MTHFVNVLGLFSLVAVFTFYRTSFDSRSNLSPQGCRMSWMYDSYIHQSDFNRTWSPLGDRYSLWLYREAGLEDHQLTGVPVLFIPGNAGSSRQVRSIASSAAHQFYEEPHIVSSEFRGRNLKPLDFFTVEFNEDLSAFHGPILDAQTTYTSRAIDYILSLYPPNTPVIILGHSMGGIVATSLLPSLAISAIITMSTPHTLPPARFDSRIDQIYHANEYKLMSDPTPILSLCGGATDLMIPSESCILPKRGLQTNVYRRTVFTSALEGAWTGVGHQEMVWCHQVRWRVARAALELGQSPSTTVKASVLDHWLRDGHTRVPALKNNGELPPLDPQSFQTLPEGTSLILKNPSSGTYLLPVPSSRPSPLKFIIYVSQGSIPPVSPSKPLPIYADIFICLNSLSLSSPRCRPLQPSVLMLIPNPLPGQIFPVPHEGSDESEGVVLFEADIPTLEPGSGEEMQIGVRINDADGRGWVVGGFAKGDSVENDIGTWKSLSSKTAVLLSGQTNANDLRTSIYFPNLLSSALVVYRVSSRQALASSNCKDALLPPILLHSSQMSETHYFPLLAIPSRSVSLHTHSSGPYIPNPHGIRGVNVILYSSGCGLDIAGFDISVDWWATWGRWGIRYWTTLLNWTVGVVALIVFEAWGIGDGEALPSVPQSLTTFVIETLPKLLVGSFIVSLCPLPAHYYLGNRGNAFFAPMAPLLVLFATGLVCVSWWVLQVVMWPVMKISRIFGRSRKVRRSHRGPFIFMGLVFLVTFLFIPWQAAFLGCWIVHLYTCASSAALRSPSMQAIRLVRRDCPEIEASENHQPTRSQYIEGDNHNFNMHFLLLMTWLLPLTAPVLAVWVRTLVAIGLTTPFDGDHNFLNVATFLVVVDFASWTTGTPGKRKIPAGQFLVRWSFMFVALVAFFLGPRAAYKVFNSANVAIALTAAVRVGPRYWGSSSWSGVFAPVPV